MKPFARALLAGALVLAASSHASDGTVTITGSVVGTTCTITGNDTGGNVKVQLPTIAASNLSASGRVSGSTPFSMALSGCKNGAANATGTVKAYFEPGPNVDLASGRLNVSGGTTTAKNVQLELLNESGSSIKIGDAGTVTGATFDTDGKATLNYRVQYYATGAAEAGTANSSVTYSLNYQ